MRTRRLLAVLALVLAPGAAGASSAPSAQSCGNDAVDAPAWQLLSVRVGGGGCHAFVLPFAFADASRDRKRVVGVRDGAVYISDLDGANVLRVAERGSDPALSRDARLVSFLADGVLWIANSDGTGAHSVGEATSAAVWSPDSRRVVFAGRALRPTVVDADGARKHELRAPPVRESYFSAAPFAWAPGGKWIAYDSSAGAYAVRQDGAGGVLFGGSSPSWSPEGRRVAVRANQELWVVTPGGRGRRIDAIQGPNSDITAPAWGPQGRLIAYGRRATIGDGFASALVAISPSDGRVRLVAAEPACSLIHQILWFPDGRRLLYTLEQTDCGMD